MKQRIDNRINLEIGISYFKDEYGNKVYDSQEMISSLESQIDKLQEIENRKITAPKDGKLEKIIIIESKPFDMAVNKFDRNTQSAFVDNAVRTGRMIFIGNQQKLDKALNLIAEYGFAVNEVYIHDRYHKDGFDMIASVKTRSEFQQDITLRHDYKEHWFNERVGGGNLAWNEGIDCTNIRF